MGSFQKRLLNRVAGDSTLKSYPEKELLGSGVTLKEEWLKWLSYEKEEDTKRYENLNNLTIQELTQEDLKFLTSYKEKQEILRLYKIYITNASISKENYLKVVSYLEKNPISKIALEKLTKDELEYVQNQMSKLNTEEEMNVRKVLKRDYAGLSMADSYLFRLIYLYDIRKNEQKLSDIDIASIASFNGNSRGRKPYCPPLR